MKFNLYFLLFLAMSNILSAQSLFPSKHSYAQFKKINQLNDAQKDVHERSGTKLLDSILCEIFLYTEWADYSIQRFGYENEVHIVDSVQVNINLGQQLPTEWLNFEKTNLFYDVAGNLVQMLRYGTPSTGVFQEILLNDYIYDNEGRLLQENIAGNEAGTWMPIGELFYYYDTDDRLINILGNYLDPYINDWILASNDTFIYNPNGDLYIEWYRGYEGDELINDEREFHYYDADGNLSETFVEAWYEDEWHANEKDFYYYELGDSDPYLILVQGFNDVDSTWEDFFRCNYKYHEETSAVTNKAGTNTLDCLVSNPFISGSTVVCGNETGYDLTATITDLNGREIFKQSLTEPVNTANLTSGYYILKITGDKNQSSYFQKLVVISR